MSDQPKPNRFSAKVSQAEPAKVKQLRIKVGSLKRTTKDLRFARKEVERECERMKAMREANSDKISQQENVIREAEMMVPHSENCVRTAISDVVSFLEAEKGEIPNEDLLIEAQAVVKDAEVALDEQ